MDARTHSSGDGAAVSAPPLLRRVAQQLASVYADGVVTPTMERLAGDLIACMRLEPDLPSPEPHVNHWDQRTALVITYADSIVAPGEKPLQTLKHWLDQHSQGCLTGVHVLPFYPYSSDDGFAVIDYLRVNEHLGDWDDVLALGAKYDLMADLVINHCSGSSEWFSNFLRGEEPGRDYFFTASPEDDLSQVVRPRTSPLLREVETSRGCEARLVHFFPRPDRPQLPQPRGAETLCRDRSPLPRSRRADLPPRRGCVSVEGTGHDQPQPARDARDYPPPAYARGACATGRGTDHGDEHPQPGKPVLLRQRQRSALRLQLLPATAAAEHAGHRRLLLPQAVDDEHAAAAAGHRYFNFIASHDGIGLRPAEGLLSDEELQTLISTMRRFGAHVSYRVLQDGENKPYEINIALFDALQGTVDGPDEFGVQRFLCAHTIMLGLEGIPGIYLHSLLGTRNDYERLERTGQNRAINRHQWDREELEERLADPASTHARVFTALRDLLALRQRQMAFHPNATQFTLHLGNQLFGFWRQSADRRQSIFCVSNISREVQTLQLSDINLIQYEDWSDLISGEDCNGPFMQLEPYRTVWITNRRDHRQAHP
jgi:sucrose phosphorylase